MIQVAFALFFVIMLVGCFCNCFNGLSNGYKKIIYWVVGVFLILFAGLRDIGIDHDSLAYQNYYYSGDLIWLIAEPTFGIIAEFSRCVFNDFRYVLIIYAILGVYLKFRAITQFTKLVWLSVLVYFSTFFLLHDFTQIRVSIASGLFLLAIIELSECKRLKYIFLILLASLFHYSSLVLLLGLFLDNNLIGRKGKWIIACAIPIGIIFSFLHINPIATIPFEIVRVKLEIYQKTQEDADVSLNVFNMVYLVKYAFLYLILIFYPLIVCQNKYISILLKIYALSLFLYIVLSSNTILAMRISELLGIVEIFIIPCLYYIVRPKMLGILLVAVVAFVYLLISIFYLELIYATPAT